MLVAGSICKMNMNHLLSMLLRGAFLGLSSGFLGITASCATFVGKGVVSLMPCQQPKSVAKDWGKLCETLMKLAMKGHARSASQKRGSLLLMARPFTVGLDPQMDGQ